MHYMNDKSKSVEYFLFHLLQDTTLSLSSLPYLNSLISEFFQHYETSMEADDVFLHGRNIVMCSHAPSKTTFYKFPLDHFKKELTKIRKPQRRQMTNSVNLQPRKSNSRTKTAIYRRMPPPCHRSRKVVLQFDHSSFLSSISPSR